MLKSQTPFVDIDLTYLFEFYVSSCWGSGVFRIQTPTTIETYRQNFLLRFVRNTCVNLWFFIILLYVSPVLLCYLLLFDHSCNYANKRMTYFLYWWSCTNYQSVTYWNIWNSNVQIPFQIGMSKVDLRKMLKSSFSGVSEDPYSLIFHIGSAWIISVVNFCCILLTAWQDHQCNVSEVAEKYNCRRVVAFFMGKMQGLFFRSCLTVIRST